jgi:membrane fusion protein (multidrug efflux system)
MQGLLNEHVISQAELDRATADFRQSDARVGEVRAVIERKKIRAPFSGILGLRQVNLGQYLAGGGELVTLQSLSPIYANFGVPQQAAGQIAVGRTVRITTDDANGVQWTGRVTAIDSKVDDATRNIQIQATLTNPDGKLRPGMFVQAEVALGPVGDLKDPDGRVYRGVRQQVVKLGPARGDQISIVSGIKPGDEVVTSGVFKLRNGAAVFVNNKVQPGNNPAPKPENS